MNAKFPSGGKELAWQYMFLAKLLSRDLRSGLHRRHYLSGQVIQRALKKALRGAKIAKTVSCHTLRQSFATHLLERGSDIRTIQDLLGHKNVNTTMIYTHVLKRNVTGVLSPLDGV